MKKKRAIKKEGFKSWEGWANKKPTPIKKLSVKQLVKKHPFWFQPTFPQYRLYKSGKNKGKVKYVIRRDPLYEKWRASLMVHVKKFNKSLGIAIPRKSGKP